MEYIAYKGTKAIAKGTLEQLSEQLKLQVLTLKHYSRKHHVEIARNETSVLYLIKAPKETTAPREFTMPHAIKQATKPKAVKQAVKVKLTKRERLTLYYQQSHLEQNYCKVCPLSNTTLDPDTVCDGCPTYQELRTIGRKLIGRDDKAKWREDMEGYY